MSCDDRATPNVPTENREINNNEIQINNNGTNNSVSNGAENIYIPKEKIIKIPVPKAECKKQITPLPPKKEFIF